MTWIDTMLFPRVLGGLVETGSSIGVDLTDTDTTWTLKVALPGIPKEKVGLQTKGHSLKLQVSGLLERVFSLPSDVRVKTLKASLSDSLLTVTAQKQGWTDLPVG